MIIGPINEERSKLSEFTKKLMIEMNDYVIKDLKRHYPALNKQENHLRWEVKTLFKKVFIPVQIKPEITLVAEIYDQSEILFTGNFDEKSNDLVGVAVMFQQELFRKFFDNEDVDRWARDFVSRLKNKEFDKYLIFKKRLVKDLSEYTSNPPVHAKAAMKLAEAGLKIPREIQYVMTQKGPAPIELMTEDIDYNFYLERQIKPLAQPVYDFLGKSFEDIWAGDQMQLF